MNPRSGDPAAGQQAHAGIVDVVTHGQSERRLRSVSTNRSFRDVAAIASCSSMSISTPISPAPMMASRRALIASIRARSISVRRVAAW